jgi:hypothetical protein
MAICSALGEASSSISLPVRLGLTKVSNSYNTDFDANCIANPDPPPDRPVGPCITAVLDLRDQKNPLDGFVVEDCAVPAALSPLMFSIMELLPNRQQPVGNLQEIVMKNASRIKGQILGPYFSQGSIQKTAVYLVMSHDSTPRSSFVLLLRPKGWS